MPGRDFHELHWLGFSSTAAAGTVFYLDNLRLKRISGPSSWMVALLASS
jgi:hypothetical protein